MILEFALVVNEHATSPREIGNRLAQIANKSLVDGGTFFYKLECDSHQEHPSKMSPLVRMPKDVASLLVKPLFKASSELFVNSHNYVWVK